MVLTPSQHTGNSLCGGCTVLPLWPQCRQQPPVRQLILPARRCADGAGINTDRGAQWGPSAAGDESTGC